MDGSRASLLAQSGSSAFVLVGVKWWATEAQACEPRHACARVSGPVAWTKNPPLLTKPTGDLIMDTRRTPLSRRTRHESHGMSRREREWRRGEGMNKREKRGRMQACGEREI